MNANKEDLRTSFSKTRRWILGAAAIALALGMSAELCFAFSAGQQPFVNISSQQTSNPVVPRVTPESTAVAAPQQPKQSTTAPSVSPSPTPALSLVPASTDPGFVFPQLNDREIVVTAVGDVMLGTTFPDETGGLLPPNDGADLLQEVTPILKRGDIVFGNLEGPLVDGEDRKSVV